MHYYCSKIRHLSLGDPLLQDHTLRTPPPSYYASTTMEETLPTYDDSVVRGRGIQQDDVRETIDCIDTAFMQRIDCLLMFYYYYYYSLE